MKTLALLAALALTGCTNANAGAFYGAGGAAASSGGAWSVVSTTTVGSGGVASVSGTGFSTSAIAVKVIMSVRTEEVAATDGLLIQVNSDTTGTNYERQRLSAASTTVSASLSGGSDGSQIVTADAASAGAGLFAAAEVLFPAINSAASYQRARSHFSYGALTAPTIDDWAWVWNSTAAVTTISITPVSGSDIAEGSEITFLELVE